ncbi:hypothetical protein L2E82_48721 [Cichorium intybus]|uniref:Uncharacterized protein n=1 Tax=Cichorium intybus TaxID=13427 RepID=A0ACB8YZ75_CICIN|nr:hypothetical protein L2E82_48721 [Cichorium intybus]
MLVLQNMPESGHLTSQSYVMSDKRLNATSNQRFDRGQGQPHMEMVNFTTDVEDFDIPWSALVLKERIGTGSFGFVYRAEWNGSSTRT